MNSIDVNIEPLARKQIALIGVGVIGRILIQRLLSAGISSRQLMVCDPDPQRGARTQREFGLKVCPLADACCRADLWLIATPPKAVLPTLETIAPRLKEGQVVVSFAAGVPMASLEVVLPAFVPVVRILPNALSLIGRGVNPVVYGRGCSLEVMAEVQVVLDALGDSIVIDDAQMNWAVGLTGASLRWLLPVLVGMTQAGMDAGLSSTDARWLAAKMMAGVAALALETDLSFDDMKSLTALQVVDEEELADIFRQAAHRAKALADDMIDTLPV